MGAILNFLVNRYRFMYRRYMYLDTFSYFNLFARI